MYTHLKYNLNLSSHRPSKNKSDLEHNIFTEHIRKSEWSNNLFIFDTIKLILIAKELMFIIKHQQNFYNWWYTSKQANVFFNDYPLNLTIDLLIGTSYQITQ